MNEKKKIVIASNNKGKIKEAKEILDNYNIISIGELGFDIDVEEDQNTFEKNAIKKAETIAKNLDGNMAWTATIIDRVQGGAEILAKEGVTTFSLGKVDRGLFKSALEKDIITNEQYDIINRYLDNPDETMKKFLIEHPEFVKDSLENGTGKTLTRAKKCVEDDVYGLGDLLKFE